MYFNAGKMPGCLAYQARRKFVPSFLKSMSDPVRGDRMDSRIKQNHFGLGFSGRIALHNRLYIAAKLADNSARKAVYLLSPGREAAVFTGGAVLAFYIKFFSFNIIIFRDTHNYDHAFRTYCVPGHSMKDFISDL